MVDIETVGAGGGSIAWVDAGGALRIGPRSAGADPGPACYGKGGTEPTVTDANLVLGYIGASTSLGGELSLDEDAAYDVLADLADEMGMDGPREAARGVYRVANANMTRAIRSVTVERGTIRGNSVSLHSAVQDQCMQCRSPTASTSIGW